MRSAGDRASEQVKKESKREQRKEQRGPRAVARGKLVCNRVT
jgi:hypothetical protein